MKIQLEKIRLLTLVLFTALICLKSYPIQASEDLEYLIKEYVEAMNDHDWSHFTDLYCEDERESFRYFFEDPINEAEHNGVLNVKNAMLKESVEIKLDDAKDMLYKEYNPGCTKVYVFGVDYDVHEESKYYSTGINYNFITFVKENNTWKVSEMIPIENPEKLVDCGYQFSDDFNAAIYIMNARKNGYFMNYEGEMFESLSGEDTKNGMSTYAVLNKRTVPTNNTIVRYKNKKGNIKKIKFHDYCLGTLAGELRGAQFNGSVRKAQAIAIKTFTWHYIIIPFGAAKGFDVDYTLQSYLPKKISENPKVTTNYNAVKSVWMESNGGAIFTAYYKLGYYEDQIKHKHGGEFKQEGARWLRDNKIATSYKKLLKYYYDSSSASTGGAIRFFDDNKNEL